MTMLDMQILTGPVFDAGHAALSDSAVYEAFRAGSADRTDYYHLVETRADALQRAGVPRADLPFVKRFPRAARACLDSILADLHRRGILHSATHNDHLLRRTEKALSHYDHGRFKTFIYPEEGMLLGAVANICAPRQAIFLGSYYGYWAHWAIDAILSGGGGVTLVDPDTACCAVARRNVGERLREFVEVVPLRGEDFLAETTKTFDMLVLDAENPRDHPDPEQRGKRVYHSLLQACLPRLTSDALLVCHNILFSDTTGDPAFAAIIARNRDELGPFAALVGDTFGPFIEYRTTEGVGIARRSATPARSPWPIAGQANTESLE